jgi:hypothetical protein
MTDHQPAECCQGHDNNQGCCQASAVTDSTPAPGPAMPLPMFQPVDDDVCCGPPPSPPSGPMEKPGYRLWPFVEDFIGTPAGQVPVVATRLNRSDRFGTFLARSSGIRNSYKIAPGLYAVGKPDEQSQVLVTANYKLTFDHLRKELGGLNVWILVLDTRGINVWCAAGKAFFGTDELIHRIRLTGLENVVQHRELILPQLGATGVNAHAVKKGSGFKVIWGPIRVDDIKAFIQNGRKADKRMRLVTFTFWERLVLAPIEVSQVLKPAFWVFLALVVLSGIGPSVFSFGAAWHRGLMALAALVMGIFAGACVTPACLPWVPGTAFSIKGTITGVLGGIILALVFRNQAGWLEMAGLILLTGALGSYLAMNFTGSTPYTSPSGVEKEMRRAIPVQALAVVLAVIGWVTSAFVA